MTNLFALIGKTVVVVFTVIATLFALAFGLGVLAGVSTANDAPDLTPEQEHNISRIPIN